MATKTGLEALELLAARSQIEAELIFSASICDHLLNKNI